MYSKRVTVDNTVPYRHLAVHKLYQVLVQTLATNSTRFSFMSSIHHYMSSTHLSSKSRPVLKSPVVIASREPSHQRSESIGGRSAMCYEKVLLAGHSQPVCVVEHLSTGGYTRMSTRRPLAWTSWRKTYMWMG